MAQRHKWKAKDSLDHHSECERCGMLAKTAKGTKGGTTTAYSIDGGKTWKNEDRKIGVPFCAKAPIR